MAPVRGGPYAPGMTDQAPAPSRQNLIPAGRPVPNPWVSRLGWAGLLLLIVSAVIMFIPPASSDTGDGTSIVNFPSMFAQYAGAILAGVLGTGFLIAWAVMGALEWRMLHPEVSR